MPLPGSRVSRNIDDWLLQFKRIGFDIACGRLSQTTLSDLMSDMTKAKPQI